MRVLAYRKGNIESYVRHPVFAASVSLSFVCEDSLVSCALGIWLVSFNPLRDDPAFSQLLPDPDPVVPETLQRLLLGGLRVRVRVHAGNYLREDALHRATQGKATKAPPLAAAGPSPGRGLHCCCSRWDRHARRRCTVWGWQ